MEKNKDDEIKQVLWEKKTNEAFARQKYEDLETPVRLLIEFVFWFPVSEIGPST